MADAEEGDWDIRVEMEGLKMFTLQKLGEFEEKLKTLESSMRELSSLDTSVSSLEHEFQSMKDQLNVSTEPSHSSLKLQAPPQLDLERHQLNVCTEPSHSSLKLQAPPQLDLPGPPQLPQQPGSSTDDPVVVEEGGHRFQLPHRLDDLDDIKLREKLAPFLPEYLPQNEFLTKVQYAYVDCWFAKRGKSMSKDEIESMIKTGQDLGIWPSDWKPESCRTDFTTYLQTKVKNMRRKRKTEEKAEELAREYFGRHKRASIPSFLDW